LTRCAAVGRALEGAGEGTLERRHRPVEVGRLAGELEALDQTGPEVAQSGRVAAHELGGPGLGTFEALDRAIEFARRAGVVVPQPQRLAARPEQSRQGRRVVRQRLDRLVEYPDAARQVLRGSVLLVPHPQPAGQQLGDWCLVRANAPGTCHAAVSASIAVWRSAGPVPPR